MNIFYLSEDPNIAAKCHNDKHVVKMILESAQILSTAHRILDNNTNPILYRATHVKHPSAKWARASKHNYQWLYNLFCELCSEYTFRYGKIHLSEKKLKDILKHPPMSISNDIFTQPPQAMPKEFRSFDSIQSYRQYYIKNKNHLATWTKRPTPDWYKLEEK